MEKNLKLQFNSKILRRANAEGLVIDHLGTIFLILFSLHEDKKELLSTIDNNLTDRHIAILYRHLVKLGFLSMTREGKVVTHSLTRKAIEMIEFVKSEYEVEEVISSETFATSIDGENVDIWIDDYIKLFPTEKDPYNTNERPLRSNKKDVLNKMEWFVKNYRYPKELILDATRTYLEAQRQDKYAFTRTAAYFIVKGAGYERISDLATACEKMKDASKMPPRIDTTFMDAI
jgi:hypothetical protein